jgi:hypothetical protein
MSKAVQHYQNKFGATQEKPLGAEGDYFCIKLRGLVFWISAIHANNVISDAQKQEGRLAKRAKEKAQKKWAKKRK